MLLTTHYSSSCSSVALSTKCSFAKHGHSAGSKCRACIWCAADRLQEQLVHPVGSGKKTRDIMSWSKQMPTFIFGIIPWNCGETRFFPPPGRAKDRKQEG